MKRDTLYFVLSVGLAGYLGRWSRIFVVQVKVRRRATMTVQRRWYEEEV
jgi:hypothetical protein